MANVRPSHLGVDDPQSNEQVASRAYVLKNVSIGIQGQPGQPGKDGEQGEQGLPGVGFNAQLVQSISPGDMFIGALNSDIRLLKVGAIGETISVGTKGDIIWSTPVTPTPSMSKRTLTVAFGGIPGPDTTDNQFLRSFGSCDGATELITAKSVNMFRCPFPCILTHISAFRAFNTDPNTNIGIHVDMEIKAQINFTSIHAGALAPLSYPSNISIPGNVNICCSVKLSSLNPVGSVQVVLILQEDW